MVLLFIWRIPEIVTREPTVNLNIMADDFEYGEFFNRGGPVAAVQALGGWAG